MNKLMIIGNLGQDPAVQNSQYGKFVRFSVATTEKGYTTKEGKVIPDTTDWHNCIVKGNLAEIAEKYLHKGDKVYVEGRVHYSSYTGNDGVKHDATDVFVAHMEMLTPKPQVQQPQQMAVPQPQPQPQYQAPPQPEPQQEQPFPQGVFGESTDLPF